jgi:hypothetical protein
MKERIGFGDPVKDGKAVYKYVDSTVASKLFSALDRIDDFG